MLLDLDPIVGVGVRDRLQLEGDALLLAAVDQRRVRLDLDLELGRLGRVDSRAVLTDDERPPVVGTRRLRRLGFGGYAASRSSASSTSPGECSLWESTSVPPPTTADSCSCASITGVLEFARELVEVPGDLGSEEGLSGFEFGHGISVTGRASVMEE